MQKYIYETTRKNMTIEFESIIQAVVTPLAIYSPNIMRFLSPTFS